MIQPRRGDRVVIAMSGGVDSSVAAGLLVEAGYDVIGVSMRLWGGPSDSGCCSLDDFLDARRVADHLQIPFYVMDFRDAFTREVVEPFVREYHRGRTPNPCALCNQAVKFADFWERAEELGAQWVATGHYARIRHNGSGEAQLLAATDAAKDQSYFLFGMDRAVLQRTLFPVGELCKREVREHAARLGLGVATKPESQEICFAPKGDYAGFVERYGGPSASAPGTVVGADGRVLATHEGVHRFTIGQRRGLGISGSAPLYVTAIEASTATVRVGPRRDVIAAGLIAGRANWLRDAPPGVGERLRIKIRSRFAPSDVLVECASASAFTVRAVAGLSAVTPGQAAVLYDGDLVVGGGWIEAALAPGGV